MVGERVEISLDEYLAARIVLFRVKQEHAMEHSLEDLLKQLIHRGLDAVRQDEG